MTTADGMLDRECTYSRGEAGDDEAGGYATLRFPFVVDTWAANPAGCLADVERFVRLVLDDCGPGYSFDRATHRGWGSSKHVPMPWAEVEVVVRSVDGSLLAMHALSAVIDANRERSRDLWAERERGVMPDSNSWT